MSEMKISNTLVNDTASGVVSYADQLMDRAFEGGSKMQSVINRQFLEELKAIREEISNLSVEGNGGIIIQ